MQVSSFMTDLIEFKDEIFKKVRLLEKQIMTELTTKYGEMHNNYEKLENRITFISENNESLLEMVTTQKVNIERMKEFESFQNRTEHNIKMHDMRIKNIATNIEKMKLKYDKELQDNFEVPGIVGAGCQFKSISEYIINNRTELSKLKYDRDQMRVESVEIKNKLDNILKSTMNLIDSSILRNQKYADNKHQEMQNILNNKLLEISEKNMDIRTHISKIELKNENQIQILKEELEKLSIVKSELITLTDRKIEVINHKIESLANNMNLIDYKNNEKTKEKIKEKENNKSNSKNDEDNGSKNNKNNEEKNINNNIDVNININNTNKTYYKIQKNHIIKKDNNMNKNDNKIIDNSLNNGRNNAEIHKINKINYNPELKRQKQNKDEKNYNLVEKGKYYSKNIPKSINNINELQTKTREEEIKYINKTNEEKNINNMKNDCESLNNKSVFDEEKIVKDFLTSDKKKTQIPIINQDKNINFMNNNIFIVQNYKNEDLKNATYFNKKQNDIKKIKIESVEKRKYLHSTSSIESKEMKNKDKEHEDEKDYDEYLLKPILLKKNDKEKEVKASSFNKNYRKININCNKTNDKDNWNLEIESKGYNTIDKSSRRKNVEYNAEQIQIMNNIKAYYNNRKEIYEQKSLENIVDCNIINLNLDKKNSEKNNIYTSKESKSSKVKTIRNNLSEIGMKITPVFGRTTYSFFNKKENSGNGMGNSRKIKSLKESLDMALIESIKQKINLNEKAINIK